MANAKQRKFHPILACFGFLSAAWGLHAEEPNSCDGLMIQEVIVLPLGFSTCENSDAPAIHIIGTAFQGRSVRVYFGEELVELALCPNPTGYDDDTHLFAELPAPIADLKDATYLLQVSKGPGRCGTDEFDFYIDNPDEGQGSPGPKGDKGDKGDPGDPGLPGSFSGISTQTNSACSGSTCNQGCPLGQTPIGCLPPIFTCGLLRVGGITAATLDGTGCTFTVSCSLIELLPDPVAPTTFSVTTICAQ